MANENTAEWQTFGLHRTEQIVNGRWEIVDSEYRTFEAGQESAYQANTKEEYPDGRLSVGGMEYPRLDRQQMIIVDSQ